MLAWVGLLVLGCGGESPPPDTDPSSPYFVDDASYLYFKNLRVKDYTLEERQTPRVDVYRHRALATSAAQPTLRVALIDNWLRDEAYLQLDLVDSAGATLEPVRLSLREGAPADETFVVGSGKPEDALALARFLQGEARRRRVLTFDAEGAGLGEYVIEVADFTAQLTTIQDYLRLIDG